MSLEHPSILTLVQLISVTCGGHGLNLTAANRAVVFDHWWHEGWERQAFARIQRIGQTKEVHTAKLVAAGSMDEAILATQARKRDTIDAAVGKGTVHPRYLEVCDALYKDGLLDKEFLEMARLEDISDDESGTGEEDDSVDSDSDTDSDGDSDDDESDGDSEDSEYRPGASRKGHDQASEDEGSDDE